jgi:CheY-like chemotaxis protein
MAYVLLVEDDEEQAVLVQRVLERDQHEIHVLLDSRRILEVIQSRQPQIVITDIVMPRFDGIKVIKAVKEFDPKIKVIAFTAVGSPDIEEKARAAGCDAYLIKPMNVATFREFVKQNL